ncbi:MAG: RNA polymerase sigma factor [Patescibacteria group bacterium]
MAIKQDNFLAYYNQFKDKIFNYFLYRIGFDKALAEDLTSEVFVKALKAFASFDENQKFQSWIYAIAHNHLINHYTRSGRATVPLEELEDFIPDASDNQFEEKYEAEQVLQVIDEMADSDRDILRFRFVDELDYREIADILCKEEGAIRTQVSRSLEKLRQKLKKIQEK